LEIGIKTFTTGLDLSYTCASYPPQENNLEREGALNKYKIAANS
jgi:hypothetical protein